MGSGHIDVRELEGLLTGLAIGDGTMLPKDALEYFSKEFDIDQDAGVTREEFELVLSKWVGEKLRGGGGGGRLAGGWRMRLGTLPPHGGFACGSPRLADLTGRRL